MYYRKLKPDLENTDHQIAVRYLYRQSQGASLLSFLKKYYHFYILKMTQKSENLVYFRNDEIQPKVALN